MLNVDVKVGVKRFDAFGWNTVVYTLGYESTRW